MEVPGASDLRRDFTMASSDVPSSDGHDLPRSEALHGQSRLEALRGRSRFFLIKGTASTHCDRPISIGRAKHGLNVELSGSSNRHQMRNHDRSRDLHHTATMLPDLPLTLAMRGTFWSAGISIGWATLVDDVEPS